MGGKTSTSTAQTTIPPEVLARYNSVNTQAQQTAATPFQQYSTDPNAFVAPMTATQNAGVANVNAASGMAQPYFNTATGFTLAGSNAVNPSAIDATAINQFQNPYLNAVLGSTSALINQNNQQAQAGQLGNAITSGAFGGDRAGIAAATLAGQQQLAAGQTYSGIASDAYSQALAAAQQQQGVSLAAQQANRAALQQTGESMAGLGTAAQGAALQGAQAQLGAGQVAQQTQQAGLTALYNQFLQQQSYPFQVAQFLANIAEGTGALSGSTTTQTTPGGLFMSDERLKEGMEPIGKGFDGANIYRFRYKGDPKTRIGFSAQETERRHPEAVHHVGGFKAVDQQAATEEAANRGGFANAANDNGEDMPRRAAQAGGYQGFGGVAYPGHVMPFDVAALLQAQEQMYGPSYGGAGLYGGSASGAPHGGSSYVPPANLPVAHLMAPQVSAPRGGSGLNEAATAAGDVKTLGTDVSEAGDWLSDQSWSPTFDPMKGVSNADLAAALGKAQGGFARAHRQYGGGDSPDDISSTQDDDPYKPKGAGLDIPTQGSKITPLQGPKVGGGGGGGGSGLLGEAAGAAGDVSSLIGAGNAIAGAAPAVGSFFSSILPFLALAHRGGRIGRAEGGGMLEGMRADLEGGDNDPLEDALLRQALAQPDFSAPPGPPGAAAPESPAGGGGPGGPPSAGFAGAKPPGAVPTAEKAGFAGVSPNLAGISPGLEGTLHAEGTGLNKASGAFGPGQFLPKTFLGEFKQVFPERAATMSDSDIMALQHSAEGPQLQAKMIPHLRAENAATLRNHGLPVNPVTEHGIWILGPSEGPKVLSADPSTPMENLVRPIAIAENPTIMKGKTAGQFVQWLGHSIGRARGGFAGARRGYQDAGLVVDPDAIDPSAGQDPDRRRLAAAPQVDPAIMAQAQLDDQVRAQAAQAAATPTPAAGAPAAQAAPPPAAAQAATPGGPPASNVGAGVAAGLADAAKSGFLPANQRAANAPAAQGQPQGLDLDAAAERARLGNEFYAQEVARQRGPQGGGFWGMLQRNWIPIAQGLAAGAAAPTSHPLTALLVGGGAFAGAEQNQRQYQLGQARTLAELEQTGENVQTQGYEAQTQRIPAVMNAMGTVMPAFENTFPATGLLDKTGTQKTYYDLRPTSQTPGKPPPTITESQRNAMQNDIRLRMLGGAFPSGGQGATANLSSLISPLYSTIAPSGGAAAPPPAAGGQPSGSTPANVPSPSSPAVPSVGGGGSSTGTGGTGSPATAPSGGASGGGGDGKLQPLGPTASLEAGLAHGDYSRSTPISLPTSDGLDPMWDPNQLDPMVTALSARGLPLADTLKQRSDDIKSGAQYAKHPDGSGDDRWIKYNQDLAGNATTAANNTKLYNQHNAEASAYTNTYQQESQILGSLINILKSNDPEGMTPQIEALVGKARSVPWLSAQLDPKLIQFVDAGGALDKENARLALMGLSGALLNHAPATGLGQANRIAPDYTKGQGAKFKLIGELGAQLAWNHQYYNDWNANKDRIGPTGRVADYDTKWGQENPIDSYNRAAYEKIPYFANMRDDEKAQFPRHPQTPAAAQKLAPDTPYYRKGDPEDAEHLRWTPKAAGAQ